MNEVLSTPFGQVVAFFALLLVLQFLYAVVALICNTVRVKYEAKQEQGGKRSC